MIFFTYPNCHLKTTIGHGNLYLYVDTLQLHISFHLQFDTLQGFGTLLLILTIDIRIQFIMLSIIHKINKNYILVMMVKIGKRINCFDHSIDDRMM